MKKTLFCALAALAAPALAGRLGAGARPRHRQ